MRVAVLLLSLVFVVLAQEDYSSTASPEQRTRYVVYYRPNGGGSSTSSSVRDATYYRPSYTSGTRYSTSSQTENPQYQHVRVRPGSSGYRPYDVPTSVSYSEQQLSPEVEYSRPGPSVPESVRNPAATASYGSSTPSYGSSSPSYGSSGIRYGSSNYGGAPVSPSYGSSSASYGSSSPSYGGHASAGHGTQSYGSPALSFEHPGGSPTYGQSSSPSYGSTSSIHSGSPSYSSSSGSTGYGSGSPSYGSGSIHGGVSPSYGSSSSIHGGGSPSYGHSSAIHGGGEGGFSGSFGSPHSFAASPHGGSYSAQSLHPTQERPEYSRPSYSGQRYTQEDSGYPRQQSLSYEPATSSQYTTSGSYGQSEPSGSQYAGSSSEYEYPRGGVGSPSYTHLSGSQVRPRENFYAGASTSSSAYNSQPGSSEVDHTDLLDMLKLRDHEFGGGGGGSGAHTRAFDHFEDRN